MADFPSYKIVITLAILLVFLNAFSSTGDKLDTKYYFKTCPNVSDIVRDVVLNAINKEARMGASLLRLHFHDCFVNGCDASILLDDTSSFTGEKTAAPNNNSVRGFEVVNNIKSAVEKACPGVVSCADILAIAAMESVCAISGGYGWNVTLGRRDARTASLTDANKSIPPPSSNLTALIKIFAAVGLSSTDLVALSGAHTIGQARCTTFRARLYNEPNSLDQSYKANCPNATGQRDNKLAPLDYKTPYVFDNAYYKNLVDKKGLLHSDQVLNNGTTKRLVDTYSLNETTFFIDFANAMIKMGNIGVLTGNKGEIRKNCSIVNRK